MTKNRKFDLRVLRSLAPSTQRVYSVMRKGTWKRASDIKDAAGSHLRDPLRRMRDLRSFFPVERRWNSEESENEYRLVRN